MNASAITPKRVPEKHGLSGRGASIDDRRLYEVWKQIRQRCSNPRCKDYRWYGLLGVRMHPVFEVSAAAFVAYVWTVLGPRPSPAHTLDRLDPTGDYAPGNMRWATPQQQTANRRRPTTKTRAA